ncbi:hypothetical protein NC653_031079 [Populus alba x Populus x berolinensis]|uniref:Uncharacterized protein n=1 Tax=Populus alba x Populus x berolinensis TaxID=444605 RepID=A0AAD6LXH4_9ROSI|nr:hypothetical protein NC653_031079 [Populus alba x Populus x berolinensis]
MVLLFMRKRRAQCNLCAKVTSGFSGTTYEKRYCSTNLNAAKHMKRDASQIVGYGSGMHVEMHSVVEYDMIEHLPVTLMEEELQKQSEQRRIYYQSNLKDELASYFTKRVSISVLPLCLASKQMNL